MLLLLLVIQTISEVHKALFVRTFLKYLLNSATFCNGGFCYCEGFLLFRLGKRQKVNSLSFPAI